MHNSHAAAVREIQSAIVLRTFLSRCLVLGSIYAMAWGTAVLLLRGVLSVGRGPLAWGAVGVAVILGVSLAAAWRRRPSAPKVCALLDRHSGAGGLYMAESEVDTTAWQGHVPAPAEMQVTLKAGRAWWMAALAIIFLLAAFLIPQRLVTAGPSPALQVAPEVARLEAQVELLRDEKILSNEAARTLEQELTQAKAQAQGIDPSKTWEALDHVQDALGQAAAGAAEAAVQKSQALDKPQALAQALADSESSLPAAVAAGAMAELASELAKADELPDDLKDALDDGSADGQALQNLAGKLGHQRGQAAQQLRRLAQARLIDPNMIRLGECKQCDAQAIADALAELDGNCTGADCEAAIESGVGKGGITRGPGSSPIAGTGETKDQGDKFRPEALNPASLQALKDSRTIGVSVGAPQLNKDAGPAAGGALRNSAAGGGGAVVQTVLPHHQGTVKRYFERPADGDN